MPVKHGGIDEAKSSKIQYKTAKARSGTKEEEWARWDDSVRKFVIHLKNSRHSKLTHTHYQADLAAFAAWWKKTMAEGDELTPRAVTEYHISAWQDHLVTTPISPRTPGGKSTRRKPATTNAKLSALKSFLKWAGRANVIPAVPEAPPREKLGHRMVRSLERRQQQTLLSRASRSKRDFAVIRMLIDSGIRVAELVEVHWRDVGMKRGGMVSVLGKGRKPRKVPTTPELRKALEAIRGEASDDDVVFQGKRGPLTVRGIQQMLERYESWSWHT